MVLFRAMVRGTNLVDLSDGTTGLLSVALFSAGHKRFEFYPKSKAPRFGSTHHAASKLLCQGLLVANQLYKRRPQLVLPGYDTLNGAGVSRTANRGFKLQNCVTDTHTDTHTQTDLNGVGVSRAANSSISLHSFLTDSQSVGRPDRQTDRQTHTHRHTQT